MIYYLCHDFLNFSLIIFYFVYARVSVNVTKYIISKEREFSVGRSVKLLLYTLRELYSPPLTSNMSCHLSFSKFPHAPQNTKYLYFVTYFNILFQNLYSVTSIDYYYNFLSFTLRIPTFALLICYIFTYL